MYQFIVTTRSSGSFVGADNSNWSGAGATVGDISTMSVAGNGTNKWASRAVVALQLAAWSAVGIVLLEKGVTTLQKHPHAPLNISLEITTPVSSRDSLFARDSDNPARINGLSRHEIDALAVVPIDGGDGSDAAGSGPRGGESNTGGVNKSAISPRQRLEQTDDKGTRDGASKNSQTDRSSDSSGKNDGKNATAVVEDKARETKDGEQKVEDKENNEAAAAAAAADVEKTWPSPVTIKVVMDNLDEHRWESRKRLRVARVNAGGGAAAAIAMVAVGAVMLVLGPAVIILRALDERRQERRFLKLSGEEDLPPSYEEATSELDQAPTYSSLNLDTILATPSTSSTNDSDNNSCANANCSPRCC